MRLSVRMQPMLYACLRVVPAGATMNRADDVAVMVDALDAPHVALFREPHVDRVDMSLLAILDIDADDLQYTLRLD